MPTGSRRTEKGGAVSDEAPIRQPEAIDERSEEPARDEARIRRREAIRFAVVGDENGDVLARGQPVFPNVAQGVLLQFRHVQALDLLEG